MGQDEELAKLIHSNPELNIRRWFNTRNHVDKSNVARTAKGRMVPNGQVYAGNVYYFDSHLNSGLKARLKKDGAINLKKFGSLTYDDLLKLIDYTPKEFLSQKKVILISLRLLLKIKMGRPFESI